eukprot:5416725-Pyramimonas_sp.AAC.2
MVSLRAKSVRFLYSCGDSTTTEVMYSSSPAPFSLRLCTSLVHSSSSAANGDARPSSAPVAAAHAWNAVSAACAPVPYVRHSG